MTTILPTALPRSLVYRPKLLLLLCCLLFCFNLQAQLNLGTSRTTSYFTYIYQITDAEAKVLYGKGMAAARPSFFHTKVDSFPTNLPYTRQLPQGHYLYTFTSGPDLEYSLESHTNTQIQLLNNHVDFAAVLYDSLGRITPNAEVKLKNKRVPFEAASQTYRLANKSKSGLLSVTHEGFTFYVPVEETNRGYNMPLLRKVVYRKPVYYIWSPFRDVAYSILHLYPSGVVYTLFNKVSNLFDGTWIDTREEWPKGYLVLNKPMYMPGDTVRYKAFLIKKNGNPYKRTLFAEITGTGKPKRLHEAPPFRPGAYEGSFVLHDSLQVRLDTNIDLKLVRQKKWHKHQVISSRFRYEDYELKENTYTLRLEKPEHFAGTTNQILVRGADANGLTLTDARVEITILTDQVKESKAPIQFIPDTLWVHQQSLENTGETTIELPVSIFPKAKIDYQVEAVFLNSSNERSDKKVKGTYSHEEGHLHLTLLKDSIKAEYLEGEKSLSKEATLVLSNASGESMVTQKITLPRLLPLQAHAQQYSLTSGKLTNRISLENADPHLQFFSERTGDSLFLSIENPRRLPFWYFVYKNNSLVDKGQDSTTFWQLNKKASTQEPYYVSVQYVWAGEVRSEEYNALFQKNELKVALETPATVYPGQKTNLTVQVTTAKGKPAANVDLTAYALTSKFKNSAAPEIPTFRKYYSRKDKRTFIIKDSPEDGAKLLQWEHWRNTMGLDSLAYYQFLYPQTGMFTNYIPAPDSLTQFAPFVVDSGRVVPVHVVYLDQVPVYFSGNEVAPPYSFPADSGYHYVKLRTANHHVILDSVYLKHGQKLILSIDQNKMPALLGTTEKGALSKSEVNALLPYLVPVEQNFESGLTYLKQGTTIQYLPNSASRHYSRRYNDWDKTLLTGPFRPSLMEFHSLGNFTTSFTPEPNYVHRFEPGLLKMREKQLLRNKVFLSSVNETYQLPAGSLAATAYTEESLKKEWQETQVDFWLSKFLNQPNNNKVPGTGRLHWQLDSTFQEAPTFFFFYELSTENYEVAIYRGNVQRIGQIQPKQYKVLLVFADHRQISTTVTIRPDGELRLLFNTSQLKAPTAESKALETYLQNRVLESAKGANSSIPIPTQKPQNVGPTVIYGGSLGYTDEVQGRVLDATDGEPMPGVTVQVKGTSNAVPTDIDGRYSINASANSILVFSFIGYTNQEVPVRSSRRIDVSMTTDAMHLDELVVVGYGIEGALQGRAAGVSVSNNSGAPGSNTFIRIRGTASIQSNSQPLYIVDGLPFSGNMGNLDSKSIIFMTTLKGTEATAMYGAAGANGVVIITTRNGGVLAKNVGKSAVGMELPDGVDEDTSIRSYFADYAFWQPRLVTDKQGKATFPVTFPGDVTSWKAHVLAMDGNRRSGQTSTEIRSFKAMMATLSAPRFLVEGDRAQIIGKAVNYLPDTAAIQTRFAFNGQTLREQQLQLARVYADTFMIQAPAIAPDSVELLFMLRQGAGFSDGERRHVGVFKKGVLERQGQFLALNKDTTVTLSFDAAKGPVHFFAQGDLLQVMLKEIEALREFEYWCNEQAASKLKGLLWEKRIREQMGEPFAHDRLIRRLIKYLEKTQKQDGTWSWWETGPTFLWISHHTTEALVMAQKEGYSTNYKKRPLEEHLVYQVEKKDAPDKIRVLEILHQLGAKVDFPAYITKLEKQPALNLEEQFRLTRLRQQLKLPAPLDTLQKYRQQTMLGGLFWGKEKSSLFDNHISNTLLAYDILKAAGGHEKELLQMQAFLLSERRAGGWRNTFESARVLETLLPDLLAKSGKLPENSLLLAGALNATLRKFPVDTTFAPGQPLTLRKTGNLPLYVTAYQNEWIAAPKPVETDFVVRTSFGKGNRTQAQLEAGTPVELQVEIEVKADASYVMVEIPIPAGCTYDTKSGWAPNEAHREYFRHKVAIFSNHLAKGKYTFTINLLPRYKGTYTLNPARAELMYFPTFFGRESLKEVEVR